MQHDYPARRVKARTLRRGDYFAQRPLGRIRHNVVEHIESTYGSWQSGSLMLTR